MSLEIEASPEQVRAILKIKGVTLGRATPEARPGVRVVYAVVQRDEALQEIQATGATVRVLKTDAQFQADAQRDAELTRAADQVRRAAREGSGPEGSEQS